MHFRAVVEPQILTYVRERAAGAGLGIARPVDQPGDPREHDRAGAHVARLEGHVERGVVEAPALHGLGGGADGEDLGVRGGILRGLDPVPASSDDAAAPGDDGADGNLAVGGQI